MMSLLTMSMPTAEVMPASEMMTTTETMMMMMVTKSKNGSHMIVGTVSKSWTHVMRTAMIWSKRWWWMMMMIMWKTRAHVFIEKLLVDDVFFRNFVKMNVKSKISLFIWHLRRMKNYVNSRRHEWEKNLLLFFFYRTEKQK